VIRLCADLYGGAVTATEVNPMNPDALETGFESTGYAQPADAVPAATIDAAWGAGNTPWQPDQFQDGYQENIYAVNFGDTPYTETASHPNPQLSEYRGSEYGSLNDNELEL
jgi:hypothetical protein